MTVGERFEILKKKYYYDEEAAEEKITFIETHCRHVEGALFGKPLILPDKYKDEIIRPAFGLKKHKGGPRLIRTVYIQMPRKNAKTTMLASIELAHLFNDGEHSAEIYNCAGDDEQAGKLFSSATKMVDLDPVLRKSCKVFKNSITYKYSFIKKITSKSDTKRGFNTHAWIYDELLVAKNWDLYEVLSQSTGQRENPMGWMITTPGTEQTSICYNQYDYAKKLLSGAIEDDRFWGVIYESDPEADIFAEETRRQANPLYDYSAFLREDLEVELTKVKNDETKENSFRRERLGQWTQSVTRWMPSEFWISLTSPNVSREDFKGETCWLGCDLSSTTDLTSVTDMYWDGDKLYPFWNIWIPEEKAKYYEKQFNVPYSTWAKHGYININQGNTIDFLKVEERILDLNDNYNIKVFAYDPWASIHMATSLQERHGIETMKQPQGYGLSAALKKMEEMIKAGNVVHNGNPVVNWTFSNILIKENQQNRIMITKPKATELSERREKKIDPWISFAMAVNEWMIDIPTKSVYSERGVITI